MKRIPPDGEMIELSGTSLYVLDEGAGQPVVFLHGWSYDHHLWDGIVPSVHGHGFRTVRYNQRGHGASPVSAFEFDDLVDDLHELLGTLGLHRPVLCGLSLGGFVATSYAISRPDALSGLVLADTCSHPIRRDAEMAASIPTDADGIEALGVWWDAGHPLTAATELAAHNARRECFLLNSATGLKYAIQACATRADVTNRLGDITAPTLVISGEHDQFFSPAMHAELAAAIPDARLHVIPEAGHISCQDRPQAFATAVTEFLTGLPNTEHTEQIEQTAHTE